MACKCPYHCDPALPIAIMQLRITNTLSYAHIKDQMNQRNLSMKSTEDVSRRSFLQTAGVAAGAAALSAKSYAQTAGANDRLNMAFIGCGGMAGAHLGALLSMREEENIGFLGVCDIYRDRAQGFHDKIKEAGGGDPAITQDYREILALDDLDYVVIATPEHSHAYLTLAALDAGKHVYCEKPMTHDVADSFERRGEGQRNWT